MFSPQDFLKLSNELLNSKTLNKNEALFRSIVSRSYYSAFLTAREKIDSLETMALNHPLHNMHQQVAEVLQNRGKFFIQDPGLSSDLVELHNYRVDADYHFKNAIKRYEKRFMGKKSPDLLQTAKDSYDLAQDIINRVNALK